MSKGILCPFETDNGLAQKLNFVCLTSVRGWSLASKFVDGIVEFRK